MEQIKKIKISQHAMKRIDQRTYKDNGNKYQHIITSILKHTGLKNTDYERTYTVMGGLNSVIIFQVNKYFIKVITVIDIRGIMRDKGLMFNNIHEIIPENSKKDMLKRPL